MLPIVLAAAFSAAQNGPALDYSVMVNGPVTAFTTDPAGNVYLAHTPSSTSATPVPLLRKIAPDGRTVLYSKTMTASSLAADAAGNVWGITSYSCSTGASCVNATNVFGTATGTTNGFVIFKLDASGNQVFLDLFVGGSATGIATDAAAAAYVTGTASCAFTTTPGSFQPVCPDSTTPHAFIAKLGAGGSILYSTFVDGHLSGTAVNGIAVDGSGNAYIVGNTQATDFPLTSGAYLNAIPAWMFGRGGFAAKLAASGASLVYGTYLPSNDAASVALDQTGNAYIAGTVASALGNVAPPPFPTTTGVVEPNWPSSLVTPGNGQGVGVAIKLNSTGTALAYATYVSILVAGGQHLAGLPTNPHIVVDSTGSAYIGGGTWRGSFTGLAGPPFPTVNAVQNAYNDSCFSGCGNGLGEGYIVRLSPDASRYLMATYFGGADADSIAGIGVTSDDTIYFSGTTLSNKTPLTAVLDPPNVNNEGFYARIVRSGGAVPVLFPADPLAVGVPGVAPGAGQQVFAATGQTNRIELGNYGGAPLAISAINITGNYSQTNNCPATLPTGDRCYIDVTATGTASGSLRVTSNVSTGLQTMQLFVGSIPPPDFALAAAGASVQTVTAGQTATYNLVLSSSGGFNGTVTISCSGAPQGATCSANPVTANLTGTTTANVSLTVSTIARTAAGNVGAVTSPIVATVTLGLAGCWFATRRRKLMTQLLAGLLFVVVVSMLGCGGSSSTTQPIQRGTPAGTYTVVVTGSSGSTSHSQNLTLTVQ